MQEFISDTEDVQTQVGLTQNGRTTGTLEGIKTWYNGWNDRRKANSQRVRTAQRGREKIYEKDNRTIFAVSS